MKKRITLFVLLIALAATLLPAVLPLTANAVNADGEVTRSEWVQQLVATFEMTVEDDNYPDNYYSDLTGEETYYRDILVAVEFGVIDLEAGLPFRPDDVVTREFAAQTLNYCLGFQLGEDTAYTFSDSAEIQSPADAQIAVNRGWVQLVDGAFKPEQPITAAEMTAMLDDAKAVYFGVMGDLSGGNQYTFKEGVIVIPETTVITVDGTSISITDCPEMIAAGNVFVIYINGIPCAYTAQTVTVNGNITTIASAEAEDEEAFTDMNAQGAVYPTFLDYVAEENVELTYIDGYTDTVYSDPYAAERAVYNSAPRGTINLKRSLGASTEIDLGGGASVALSFKIKDPYVEYDFSVGEKHVYAALIGDTELSYEAKLEGKVTTPSGKPIKLFTCNVGGIGNFVVSLDISAEGSVKGSESGKLTLGLEYANGDVRMVKEFQEDSFSLVMEVSGKVGINAKLGVTEMPILNAYVFGNIGGTGSAKVTQHEEGSTPRRCVHFTAYLYADFGAEGTAKFLGIINEKITLKYEVFHEDNSPLRVYHHYEDGVEVPSCTCDNPAPGMTGYGYFTPGTSKYWGSGWSGSSGSTGYKKDKTPFAVYKYSLDDDGNATLTSYNGNATALIIPSTLDGHTIVGIGKEVFKNWTMLRSVNIPDTVTTIGDGAFSGCTNLSQVKLSNNLTTIGSSAFSNCKSLETIDIPDSVTEIKTGAFSDCSRLYRVKLSNNLKTMGSTVFARCTSLPEIFIPKSLETCGAGPSGFGDNLRYNGIFYECSALKKVTLEDGITFVPDYLLRGCPGIESITIPDSVTYIGQYAFYSCDNLKEINFSKNITDINHSAFQNCIALEKVEIPDSVTKLHNGVFSGCTALTSVKLSNNLEYMGSTVFAHCTALPEIFIPKSLESCGAGPSGFGDNLRYNGIFYECSALKKVTLEEGITSVPDYLLRGCPGIESITIPDSVTFIGQYAFYSCDNLKEINFSKNITDINHSAFQNCIALEKVEIPDSVTKLHNGVFSGCTALTYVKLSNNLEYMGSTVFAHCTALPEIFIPKSLVTCGAGPSGFGDNLRYNGIFYECSALKKITLEEGIPAIPDYLLRGCPGFESITIPESVTSIGSYAFYSCTSLKDITIHDKITKVGTAIFQNCTALTTVKWPDHWKELPKVTFYGCISLTDPGLPEGLEKIGDSAFNGCDALTEFKLPAALTTLGESAFYDCSALESVQFNDALVTIGNSAFRNCDALKTITIPNKVTTIGGDAFYDCDALTTATLGDSVKTIGGRCFYDSDLLTDVTMTNSVTELGGEVFYHCDKLVNVTLSRNLSTIASKAFYECVELEEISIPYYVTKIDDSAFNSCPKLLKVILPRGVAEISNNAFSYPDRMSVYGVPGTYAETWAADNGYQFVANEIPATAAALEASELTMNRSASKQLTLTITPADSTDAITWKSSDDKVVTVDDKGNIKAVGVGEATVKVTVGSATASVKITVVQPATNINLNKTKLTLDGGATYQLTATVKPDNAIDKSVVWSSSAPAIASVDETGLVAAHAKGTAEITVTMVNGGITNTCAVTVANTQTVPETVDGMESPHDYALSCTDSWKYSIPNAEMLAVTFDEKTELEDSFDFLYIYDAEGKEVGKYTGKTLAGQTVTVPGDTVVIKLSTDEGGTAWGFKVTSIEATHEHSFGDWTETTAPTCTEDGVETRICECGETESRAVEALSHMEETISAKDAACTEDGLTEGTKCSVCGEILTKQEPIPATGHKEVIDKAVDPTCDKTGLTEGKHCSVCNEVLVKQTEVPAKGHSFTDGKCTECGAADPDYVEPTPVVTPEPTVEPTPVITPKPTVEPTPVVTPEPTVEPTPVITPKPTVEPTPVVTPKPTVEPTPVVTPKPTVEPTPVITPKPTVEPTPVVTPKPTVKPTPTPTPMDNPFIDVAETDYFYAPVMWAVQKGVTGGTSPNTFSPNNPCTRGQVVTFLWAASGRPEPKNSVNPFTDVSASDYYCKAVLWAVENAITGGTSATTFSPNAPCTRAQVATFLYAAQGKPALKGTAAGFSDVASNAWYVTPVLWAVENGVTGGIGNGMFGPDNTCTRGQIATFLYKAMGTD